jgi:hypothetical protein
LVLRPLRVNDGLGTTQPKHSGRRRTTTAVSRPDTPPLPRCFFDASLLFRCMDMLDVNRSDLEQGDPLLFREFARRVRVVPQQAGVLAGPRA